VCSCVVVACHHHHADRQRWLFQSVYAFVRDCVYVRVCVCVCVYACVCVYVVADSHHTDRQLHVSVGSIKLQVSLTECNLFCRDFLQKRPTI